MSTAWPGAGPLLLASANPKKRDEMQRILAGLDLELRSLADLPELPVAPETAETFDGNARGKALHYARHTGLVCVADDSGLEVDALQGAPGVRSARFAGEGAGDARNRGRLLAALEGVPETRRSARFRCALAVAADDHILFECDGVTEGRILLAERGAGGFGYDPLFLSSDLDLTFAECRPQDKDRVSHRGRALAGLIQWLQRSARSS